MKFGRFWLILALATLAFTAFAVGRTVQRLSAQGRFFPIRQVQVLGLKLSAASDVVALTGLQGGESLVFCPTGAITRQVEASPRYESVKVERVFPQTLRITLTERLPLVLLRVGNTVAEVDREGRILGRGPVPLQGDLPVIRVSATNVEAAVESLAVRQVLSDLGKIPEKEGDLLGALSGISLGAEIEVYPRKPRTRISLGAASDLNQWRRARYALLYAQEKKMDPRRIDLRTDPVKYVL